MSRTFAHGLLERIAPDVLHLGPTILLRPEGGGGISSFSK
jgi:hypothetical protein